MKKSKRVPKFKNSSQEEAFWNKHDSTEYINWSKASIANFPSLRPSTESISLRLPEDLLNEIKILANKQDIPYQSFMKILLTHGVNHFRNP